MRLTHVSHDPASERNEEETLQCVWMLAGVVNYKLCDRGYGCENCSFDWAMREAPAPGEITAAPLAEGPGASPLHPRGSKKHADAKTCLWGFGIAPTLFHYPTHLWVRVEEGGSMRVGLDDFGQKLVGRVYSVEMPNPGAKVLERHASWRLSHASGETALPSPVTGTVEEINTRLSQQPSLINRQPYDAGWVMVVMPDSVADSLQHLYYGPKALAWHQDEVVRLERELRSITGESCAQLGETLQDGGTRLTDLRRIAGPSELKTLIDRFLTAASAVTLDGKTRPGGPAGQREV